MSGSFKEQRIKLYRKQKGRCYYCEIQTVLLSPAPNPPPHNMATLEHLDSRYSPLRGAFSGQKRHVMACWKCNNQRSIDEHNRIKQEHEEVLRRRGENKTAAD